MEEIWNETNLQEVAHDWMFQLKFGDIRMELEVQFILELLVSETFSTIMQNEPFLGQRMSFNGENV